MNVYMVCSINTVKWIILCALFKQTVFLFLWVTIHILIPATIETFYSVCKQLSILSQCLSFGIIFGQMCHKLLPGCGHPCWCCRCAVCTMCQVSSPHTHTLWQAHCRQCPTDWLPKTRHQRVKQIAGQTAGHFGYQSVIHATIPKA